MTYLLDSDVIIDFLRGRPATVERIAVLSMRPLFISVITYGEVYEGVAVGSARPAQAEQLSTLLHRTRLLPVDRNVAERWAMIRHDLRQRGERILDADMLIAATALQHDLTLVTRNVGHFARVEGLRLL